MERDQNMRRKLLDQDRLQISNQGPLIAIICGKCDFSPFDVVSKINLTDFAGAHFSVVLRNIDPKRFDVPERL